MVISVAWLFYSKQHTTCQIKANLVGFVCFYV